MGLTKRWPTGVVFLVLATVVGLGVAVSCAVGLSGISVGAVPALLVGRGDSVDVQIVQRVRAPRAIAGVVVGAALGAAGAAFQALFRNPLADPFVVGSSSGAALGVAVVVVAGLGSATAGAFLGAVAAVGLVFGVSAAGRLPPVGLLLAGAAVSTTLSGIVWVVVVAAGKNQYGDVIAWLMGGLAGVSWAGVTTAAPLVAVSVLGLTLAGRGLDAVATGDETARSLGLPLGAFAGAVLAAAGLGVAAAVAVAGVVGFVGLMAPHAARALVGASHVRLVPASALIGAGLVVAADLLARVAVPPQQLPLGVVTSLVGGPFFLVILNRVAGAHRP